MDFANFWQRLLAGIVDYCVIWILSIPIGVVCIFFVGDNPDLSGINGILFCSITGIVAIAMTWLYCAKMESSELQATIGKRVVGVVVTDRTGNRITFDIATRRFFAKIVSILTLGYGFLMPLWSFQRQALHDRIAETLVVKIR